MSDKGIGIAGELLPHVFDLFTQGTLPGGSAAGLGIGLALARRITEMHGGSIEATSAGPGTGAEFIVRLPVVHRGAAGILSRPDGGTRLAVRRRVLIIDDNADAAEMLAVHVRALGGEARTATDGASGIRAAIEFAPGVVLLDIGMPGMDGYETCRQLRERLGAGVFIAAVSGWGQDRDKARAAVAGFDAHFTKPVDPATIERLLAEPSLADRR